MQDFRPSAWVVPGLFVVGLLTVLAMMMRADTIERDLTSRALAHLSKQHAWAHIVLDGRNLQLTGTAPNAEMRNEALRLVDGIAFDRQEGTWGVRVVDGRGVDTLMVRSPYETHASLMADKITLKGFVLSEKLRESLVSVARATFKGKNVEDQLVLAGGAPEMLEKQFDFAARLLGMLEVGELTLSDGVLSLSGRAGSQEAFASVTNSLAGGLPAGLALGSIDIAPPLASPYIFSAERKEGTIVLSGNVPDQAGRAMLLGSALEIAAAAEDKTRLSSGEPRDFSAKATYILSLLRSVSAGTITLMDATLNIAVRINDFEAAQIFDKTVHEVLPHGLVLGQFLLEAPAIAETSTQQAVQPALPQAAPVETPAPISAPAPPPVQAVAPYRFTIIKNADELILSGSVPSQALQNDLSAKATALGFKYVSDTSTIAETAPQGFEAVAAYALQLVALFTDGSVLISDRQIAVDGTARSAEAYQMALEAITRIPAGFELVASSIDLPIVSPYVWQASRKDGGVVVQGFVPDADRRERSEKALEIATNKAVINQLEIAEGNPAGLVWHEATDFAAKLLGHLQNGHVALSDRHLSLTGEAATFASYEAILSLIATAMPDGMDKGAIELRHAIASPYRFTAERVLNGELKLSGFIPDEASGNAMHEAVARRFGAGSGAFDLTLAGGAPQGFNTALDNGLLALSRLNYGLFSVSDHVAMLSGEVPFGAPLNEIRTQFEKGMPVGFSGVARLTQAEPPVAINAESCEDKIVKLFNNNSIYFETAKATILADSFGLLDTITALALSCHAARFEIIGHTDSDGSENSNLRLSEARAKAVVAYLSRAGVGGDRLRAVGRGESEPVAANDTPENKALNRRIQFKLTAGN